MAGPLNQKDTLRTPRTLVVTPFPDRQLYTRGNHPSRLSVLEGWLDRALFTRGIFNGIKPEPGDCSISVVLTISGVDPLEDGVVAPEFFAQPVAGELMFTLRSGASRSRYTVSAARRLRRFRHLGGHAVSQRGVDSLLVVAGLELGKLPPEVELVPETM